MHLDLHPRRDVEWPRRTWRMIFRDKKRNSVIQAVTWSCQQGIDESRVGVWIRFSLCTSTGLLKHCRSTLTCCAWCNGTFSGVVARQEQNSELTNEGTTVENVQQGYRCGPGVGLQSSDIADLSSKTTFANCSRIGVWDESEECLVAVQA